MVTIAEVDKLKVNVSERSLGSQLLERLRPSFRTGIDAKLVECMLISGAEGGL